MPVDEHPLAQARRRALAGHTLASAAQAMGIARSTAVTHLSALFRATGTRRQQDLIRHLSRDPFG